MLNLPHSNCQNIDLISKSVIFLTKLLSRESDLEHCSISHCKLEEIMTNMITILNSCMDGYLIMSAIKLLEVIFCEHKEKLSQLLLEMSVFEMVLSIICDRLLENCDSFEYSFIQVISVVNCDNMRMSSICILCQFIELVLQNGIVECVRERLFVSFLHMFSNYTYQLCDISCISSAAIIKRRLYLQFEEHCSIVLILTSVYNSKSSLHTNWENYVLELPLSLPIDCIEFTRVYLFTLKSYQLLKQCLSLCAESALRCSAESEDVWMFFNVLKWSVTLCAHLYQNLHAKNLILLGATNVCMELLCQLKEWMEMLKESKVVQWINNAASNYQVWLLLLTLLERIAISVLGVNLNSLVENADGDESKLCIFVNEMLEIVNNLL